MTYGTVPLRGVAAATVGLGGLAVVAFPHHTPSIARVVVLTLAAAAAWHALSANVPPSGWLSPYRWMSPFRHRPRRGTDRERSREFDSLRARLSGRRQPVPGGPPLPPEALRLLRSFVRLAVGLDPEGDDLPSGVASRLSPATRAVATTRPLERPGWLGTRRPDPRGTAEAVHRILDEIELLTPGSVTSGPHTTHEPPTT